MIQKCKLNFPENYKEREEQKKKEGYITMLKENPLNFYKKTAT